MMMTTTSMMMLMRVVVLMMLVMITRKRSRKIRRVNYVTTSEGEVTAKCMMKMMMVMKTDRRTGGRRDKQTNKKTDRQIEDRQVWLTKTFFCFQQFYSTIYMYLICGMLVLMGVYRHARTCLQSDFFRGGFQRVVERRSESSYHGDQHGLLSPL